MTALAVTNYLLANTFGWFTVVKCCPQEGTIFNVSSENPGPSKTFVEIWFKNAQEILITKVKLKYLVREFWQNCKPLWDIACLLLKSRIRETPKYLEVCREYHKEKKERQKGTKIKTGNFLYYIYVQKKHKCWIQILSSFFSVYSHLLLDLGRPAGVAS